MDFQTKIRLTEAKESITFAENLLLSIIDEKSTENEKIRAAIDQIESAKRKIESAFYLSNLKQKEVQQNSGLNMFICDGCGKKAIDVAEVILNKINNRQSRVILCLECFRRAKTQEIFIGEETSFISFAYKA
ncbi:uncharacterized protein Dvar_51510 [Desulfosarcina variabilis str. Montpellier]|uniref:hypothetical protein n=1 Tax=Desulfosarcina variabilis TaxID=2300 RepID=UPI003AFA6655